MGDEVFQHQRKVDGEMQCFLSIRLRLNPILVAFDHAIEGNRKEHVPLVTRQKWKSSPHMRGP